MPVNYLKILFVVFLFVACNTTYQPTTDVGIQLSEKVEPTSQIKPENKYPYDTVTKIISGFNADKIKFNLLDKQSILKLYKKNKYQPLWVSDTLIVQGIQLIQGAKFHGLNPNDYGYQLIDSLYAIWQNKPNNYTVVAELEMQLTRGVYVLSKHLLKGKLNPKEFHASWNYSGREIPNKDSVLLSLLKQERIKDIVPYFEPHYLAYKALKNELEYYYQKLDDTVNFKGISYPGFIPSFGDSNKYVAQLKKRLQISDSLPYLYTQELNDAIKLFQIKHGLFPDGKPGNKTYEFLAWNSERYIHILKINLERYRWFDTNNLNRGIEVNIPAFKACLWNADSLILETSVIVGKRKNETPIFHSEIDYLVFNPCWTVPNSIALKKMLPKLKVDSLYLDKHNMFIGLNGVEQPISGINFNNYTEANFPYKIYQRTGSDNALGKVKFMFDNKYSIYLHDTPGKKLFLKDYRALSHGCVRVNNAMKLADNLLYIIDKHERSIPYYLKKGYPEKVYFSKPIPISLVYLTCNYSYNKHQVLFFNDVYIYDYKVLMALDKKQNL